MSQNVSDKNRRRAVKIVFRSTVSDRVNEYELSEADIVSWRPLSRSGKVDGGRKR